MKRIHTISAAAAAAIAVLAPNEGVNAADTKATQHEAAAPVSERGTLSKADQTFLQRAAEINLTEIEMGKAAEQHATNADVKKIGQELTAQHTRANQQLERLAASKGINLPDKLPQSTQQKLATLREKKGADFDKAFLKENIQGHQQAIALFEKEAGRTSDSDLKSWANEMIPNLKQHLAAVRSASPEAVGERGTRQQRQQQQQPQQRQQQQQKSGY